MTKPTRCSGDQSMRWHRGQTRTDGSAREGTRSGRAGDERGNPRTAQAGADRSRPSVGLAAATEGRGPGRAGGGARAAWTGTPEPKDTRWRGAAHDIYAGGPWRRCACCIGHLQERRSGGAPLAECWVSYRRGRITCRGALPRYLAEDLAGKTVLDCWGMGRSALALRRGVEPGLG